MLRDAYISLLEYRGSALSLSEKLFAQSRTPLGLFLSHLTVPGLRVPTPGGGRSLQSTLSRKVTTALNRALHQQNVFLPRPPATVARMTQVGLGTARNFSSRPIFQNL